MARPASGSTSGARRVSARKGPRPQKWLENVGLIVVVILILAITITRYWHNIHWSTR